MHSPGHAEVREWLAGHSQCYLCVCTAAHAKVTLSETAAHYPVCTHNIKVLDAATGLTVAGFTAHMVMGAHNIHSISKYLLTSSPPGGQPHLRKSLW